MGERSEPMSVKSLQINNVTSSSVSLTWSKPDEYKTFYSYRVQTNVSSSSTMLHNTIVTSESATIMTLTPGETYTFLIYTRAADNITESDPVSYTTCTVPGQVSSISLYNNKSVDSLGVTWTKPSGNVTNYTVSLTGGVTNTTQTTATQVTITGLLPGREYSVTVQTNSGTCSQISAPVTQATYPTPPRNFSINTVTTNSLTLSWMEPVNMTGVDKSYNISYVNSSGTWTVTSNTTSVTLQNLTSGTNYTITVVTVGVRGYQSSAVSTSVYTRPMSVKSLQSSSVTSSSVSLTWSKPDEYKTSYSYRVQINVSSSSTMLYNTTVTSESATIMNLTAGETYTFLVYTRAADNITESDPVSYTTCTGEITTVNC
ncbi:receptor-type tyrosine-protein phosphatase eta-like [Engystomops pustulosus]|uniref:receptor-type tyrosine-protein phosphatase eta-like n=1 Tax=Engystomops pustulosus TaxID=76066 RepID=UPI003AFAD432